MGWAELPLEIIENIIHHAAKGEKKTTKPCWWRDYDYANLIREYGQVHPSWKRAIIFSRTIFQRDKSLPADELCPKRASSSDRQFIEEGYLPAVQSLYVDGNFELIFDSLVERNSVEWLGLKFNRYTEDFTEKTSRQVNKLLKLLSKAKQFEITIHIYTQNQAKWLWELMCLVVHTNHHPKTIKFNLQHHPSVDWSFIVQEQQLDIGSISLLTFGYQNTPVGLFSRLANIDTVIVDLNSILRSGNAFVENIKASCLQINLDLKPRWTNNYRRRFVSLLDDLLRDKSQPSFKVKTVKCVVIMSDSSNRQMILWLSRMENQQIFEADATALNKIKGWFWLTCQVNLKHLKTIPIIDQKYLAEIIRRSGV